MPDGKPAGVRCVQLDTGGRCRVHGTAQMPGVCSALTPNREMCGATSEEALAYLERLELATRP
jgi:hypothetical protein